MTRLPHAREVDRAFRLLRSELRTALRELNAAAGQAMSRGDYEKAEALAVKGRELQEYQAQLDGVLDRWRAIKNAGGGSGKPRAKPQWAYYQPVLKALVECGGEGTRREIESRVLARIRNELQIADHRKMAGGRERWQIMIHRSRGHLIREGWLEPGSGPRWRITDAGRRAAESPGTLAE